MDGADNGSDEVTDRTSDAVSQNDVGAGMKNGLCKEGIGVNELSNITG